MDKYVRYSGSFLSHGGTVWRVDIMQDAEEPFEKIGELTFEAEEAVVIEWEEKPKHDVICGSTATIRVESPGDRTYEDLYTIEPGSIRMDVYRDGVIYWSGALDPEFYEEPYERASMYVVSLTFSDFGILDRKKYASDGMKTLSKILDMCLQEMGIKYIGIDQSMISTELVTAEELLMPLDALKVRSDNFYDEDGEASTLQEVLEGVFQPLGLRIIQKAGTIYVYDLNGLYAQKAKEAIWDGDSSTMGTDSVYNNAKITWSPYAQSGNLAPDTCWTEDTDANLTALNNLFGATMGNSRYYSFHYSTDLEDWVDNSDCGFTLWVSDKGENAEIDTTKCKFFKIVSQCDGTDCEGIAVYFRSVAGITVTNGSVSSKAFSARGNGRSPQYLKSDTRVTSQDGMVMFKSSAVWIPPVDNSADLSIRIVLNLLVDPRFNPFESAVKIIEEDQKAWQDRWNSAGNYFYVPVCVKYQKDGDNTIYCWDNTDIVNADIKDNPISLISQTYGKWVEYTESNGKPNVVGYFAYYDVDDRGDKSGVANGFADNRPAINPHTGKIYTALSNIDAGQYIRYPDNGGGKLWVEVLDSGWMYSDAVGKNSLQNIKNLFTDLWDKISWVLFKLPEIELVNSTQFEKTISTDDVEYSAEISASAKESLELDTICGSAKDGIPTARGAYFSSKTGRQIRTLSRAGRTTQIEELLIGTLYSQYAGRKTKLSGEMVIDPGGLVPYSEQNQGEKKFIMVGETQDLITDTTEATIIELRPDEYEKSEIVVTD
jgi:hypothetical protein